MPFAADEQSPDYSKYTREAPGGSITWQTRKQGGENKSGV